MKRVLAAVAIVLLALDGCAGRSVTGVVTEKEREGLCWEIEIREADGDLVEGCVTKTQYNSVKLGDTFTGTMNVDYDEDNEDES